MKIHIPTWNLMQLFALEKVSDDDLLRKNKGVETEIIYISIIVCYLS